MEKETEKNKNKENKKTEEEDKKKEEDKDSFSKINNSSIKLTPTISKSSSFTKYSFPSFSISSVEYPEGKVGCTLLLFNHKTQTVILDRRGGFPGTIDFQNNNTNDKVHGIAIVGGSAVGLSAITGMMKESFKYNQYKDFYGICGAVIFSQNLLKINSCYPDEKLGSFAFNNLKQDLVYNGQVGAGLSASHGQGSSYHEMENGVKIFVLTVVNALGDVFDKENKIIHHSNFPNAFKRNDKSGKLIPKKLSKNEDKKDKKDEKDENHDKKHTTITIFITNLKMGQHYLKQYGKQLHDSMYRSIQPFHSLYDGDCFYTISTQELDLSEKFSPLDWIQFGHVASECVWDAVIKSVKQ